MIRASDTCDFTNMKRTTKSNVRACRVDSNDNLSWKLPDNSFLTSLPSDIPETTKIGSKGRPRDIIHSHFIRTPLSRRVTCRYCSKSFNWSNVKHGWRHFSGMRSCRNHETSKWQGPCKKASRILILEARRRIGLYSERAVRRRAPPAPAAVRAFFDVIGIDYKFTERPEFKIMCAAIRASSPEKVPKNAEDLRKARAELAIMQMQDDESMVFSNNEFDETPVADDLSRSVETLTASNSISRLLNDEPQEPISRNSSSRNDELENNSQSNRTNQERDTTSDEQDLILEKSSVEYGVCEFSSSTPLERVEDQSSSRKSFARPRKRQNHLFQSSLRSSSRDSSLG